MTSPPDLSRWDVFWLRVADIPWGVLAFLILTVMVASDTVAADQIDGLAAGAGLMGVGHGLHTGAKHLRAARSRDRAPDPKQP